MNRGRIRVARALAAATLLAWALAATGCATVRPYERERLVDPIMSFEARARDQARRIKALESREGSTGGIGGAGGGCACN